MVMFNIEVQRHNKVIPKMYRLMLSRKVPLIMHAYYMWRAHNFMIKLGFTFLVHFLNAKVWPHWQLLPVYYLDSYVLSSKVSRVQRVVWPAEGIIGLIAPLCRRHSDTRCIRNTTRDPCQPWPETLHPVTGAARLRLQDKNVVYTWITSLYI